MWAKTSAIWLILAAAAFAQNEDEKKKDDEAKAKIADFKKELKTAKNDKDIARAIEGLGALQHPKVFAEMKPFLSKGGESAVTAAEQISKYKKDKDAGETLVGAASATKEKDLVVKFIRYAGDVEYKGIVPKLSNLFRHKEVDAAKEAVDSCAKLRTKDAIDPLLNLWKEMEAIREEKTSAKDSGLGSLGGVAGGGIGQSYQDEQLKRKRDLTPAVETALKKITGEEFKDLRAANDWWRKNKGTFKDPE
jgi:hypothetical protein